MGACIVCELPCRYDSRYAVCPSCDELDDILTSNITQSSTRQYWEDYGGNAWGNPNSDCWRARIAAVRAKLCPQCKEYHGEVK
jgi:Zn ribbon nucleic-acid-binding protein